MGLLFTKMQGLGNDFVIIDGIHQTIELDKKQIQQMADRHFGIGFDQLLIVEPAANANTDFNLRIFNADGSATAQCGNGVRCAARFVYEQTLTAKTQFVMATDKTAMHVRLETDAQVTVNMGIPNFQPSAIPFSANEPADVYSLEIEGIELTISAVSLGNPHAVLIVPNVQSALVQQWGPSIAQHPRFPESVNVGFMQIMDRHHVALRVYERGAGETLACGSGACAAVAIGRQRGLLDSEVTVNLPGGCLAINWPGLSTPLWMKGPATTVFTGEWLNPKD